MLPKVKSHQIQRKGDHLRDRPEFMSKCYYVLDNQFLKHHIERHKIYTMVVMTGMLSGMLKESVQAFKKMMDEYNGSWATNIAEYFILPINGVHSRMRNAVEAIYPTKVDKKVFSEGFNKYTLGFEIIGQKTFDYHRAEKALVNACIFSGLNLDINGIIVDGEGAQDNTGTPWNEAQLRALTTGMVDAGSTLSSNSPTNSINGRCSR